MSLIALACHYCLSLPELLYLQHLHVEMRIKMQ